MEGGPVSGVPAPVQERQSESPPCAALQDGAPPPQPHGLHFVLQQKWHRLCLRLRKASEEMGRLIWPPAPSLSSQHHPLLPTPGTWSLSCAALPRQRALRLPRSPIPPERRHQCGVESQLGSLPQGQPVCDHLDPSIEAIESSHVEVVWGHPNPASRHTWAAAHSRRNPHFPKTPASEHAAR